MRIIMTAALVILFLASALDGSAQRKKATKENEVPPAERPAEVLPQPQPSENDGSMLEHYYKKYAMASRWNDGQVAKDALYEMILLNPESDSLIFTLAYYYFESRQYAPAMLVSQELLARDSKNLSYLELSAASFEELRITDQALQNYETLYLLSNNTLTLYKIAFLQYELERYEEGLTNVDILLGKPDADTVMIGFADANNKTKDFPMKLPVMNLKGLLLEGKGDKAEAKKVYEDVIKLAPDFQLAIVNLAELNKK